jgi:hypothetical protein
VIVIVGLIVGGVLMGRDLVRAAAVRAQITQIQSYQAAIHAFETKYLALPGDIPNRLAQRFGLASRGQFRGEGDGNGLIEGNYNNTANGNLAMWENGGETTLIWNDLSVAGLIGGSFPEASASTPRMGVYTSATSPSLSSFFPTGKISGTYIYIWSPIDGGGGNFFGLSALIDMGTIQPGVLNSNPGLTTAQAYGIDKKIDDGLPQSGAVLALYSTAGDNDGWWAGLSIAQGWNYQGVAPYTNATPASSITCFDNGNTPGATQNYSVQVDGGGGVNCALSFQFQ